MATIKNVCNDPGHLNDKECKNANKKVYEYV